MFTGIVEALGRVQQREPGAGGGVRLRVGAPPELVRTLGLGGSVAVNGVCLTVVDADVAAFEADLADETLRVTALGDLAPDDPVNLERPLRVGDRLGGHWVLGHVDTVGRVTAVAPEGNGRRLGVAVAEPWRRLLVAKGSVTVDGVSLTVAELTGDGFSVALIPHTLAATTLGARGVGARVNLETDVIGKYVQALLPGGPDAEAMRAFLVRHGLAVPAGEA